MYGKGISLSGEGIPMYGEGISLYEEGISLYREGIPMYGEGISMYGEGILYSVLKLYCTRTFRRAYYPLQNGGQTVKTKNWR